MEETSPSASIQLSEVYPQNVILEEEMSDGRGEGRERREKEGRCTSR